MSSVAISLPQASPTRPPTAEQRRRPSLPPTDPHADSQARMNQRPFHAERGKFVRGTRDAALALCERYGWTRGRYARVVEELVARLPRVIEGREGFLPAE